MSSRVTELVNQLQGILAELVEIEEESNKVWREHSETLNVLDHEIEIIPLKGGQLLKVASFRRKLRLERRKHKHNWYCAKAFNDSFQTTRILNSMTNAYKNLRRQESYKENLIQDRGLIAKILAEGVQVEEVAPPTPESLQQVAQQIAATLESAMASKQIESGETSE